MHRTLCLFAAVALLAGIVARPVPDRVPPARAILGFVRPFLLPTLWHRLETATRQGDPAATIAVGVAVTALLPEWTDGVAHFAWELATAHASEARSDSEALDRVLRAVAWLEEEAARREAAAPGRAAELLVSAAAIARARAGEGTRLATAFRERLGRDAAEIAHGLVVRATRIEDDETWRRLGGHLAVRAVAGALRAGSVERAEALRTTAIATLATSDDPYSRRVAAALERLGDLGLLTSEAPSADDPSGDPLLRDVFDALAAFRRGSPPR